jgi:hypothetical protein
MSFPRLFCLRWVLVGASLNVSCLPVQAEEKQTPTKDAKPYGSQPAPGKRPIRTDIPLAVQARQTAELEGFL